MKLSNNIFFNIMGLPTLLKPGKLRPGMGEPLDLLNTYRPIDYILDWFKLRLERDPKSLDDRIIVALSTTGSGKSTVLPTELYLKFSQKLKNIIVTQPRVVTAIDIPKTIVGVPVYKSKMKLGKNIGFQTGDYVKKPLDSGILFSTVGILLQFLKTLSPSDFCRKYNLIILDEAHDRSTQLDLVFYHLKKLTTKVPLDKLPFIICTSGTMDVELYKKYFNTSTTFIIDGDSYPIEDNYLEWDTTNVLNAASDRIQKIHALDNSGSLRYVSDIVLFSPTNGVINKMKKIINELNEKDSNFSESKLLPIGLDSAVFKAVRNEYTYVFDNIDDIPIENLKRKIIMGTNSIETGITLESISYCIDTGLVNSLEYNPIYNQYLLLVRPVTKAMAKQRRGRVGRIQNGYFYGLYSKETFDKLQDIQYPELITTDVTAPLLGILVSNIDVGDNKTLLKKIDTMEKIPDISISNSLNRLHTYGLIKSDLEGEIYVTDLGRYVNKIRMLSPETALLILHKDKSISSLDMITLASYLTVGKKMITDRKFKFFQSDNLNKQIKNIIKCEWIEFLVIFQEFRFILKEHKGDVKKVIEFCRNCGIDFDGMIQFIEFRYDIMLDLNSSIGIVFSDDKDIENIFSIIVKMNSVDKESEQWSMFRYELIEKCSLLKKIFYKSFKLNMAKCIEPHKFLNVYTKQVFSHYTFVAAPGDIILFDSIMIKKNITGKFAPEVVNGVSNISISSVPIEPPIHYKSGLV